MWEEVSMNFITGLHLFEAKGAIFAVVKCLTKYDHFISLTPKFVAFEIAYLFCKHVHMIHGIPHYIMVIGIFNL